jgi:hypothetical protein
MKTTIMIGLLLGLVRACPGQQTVAEYDWKPAAGAGQVSGAVPVSMDSRAALRIANTNSTALRVQLLKIEKPPVSKTFYALVGEVKYEQVQGDGYLEMWSCFSPPKPGQPEVKAFSRTLGESGEMGKLAGTSDWRPLMLPFDSTGASGPLVRIEVNLVLPGKGVVYLGPLKLVEYSGSPYDRRGSSAGAWWSGRTAGFVGGISGGTVGCLASLLAWLASKGRARPFVVGASVLLIGLGGLSAAAGLVALGLKQPYEVWFPLLLLGVLLLAIVPVRLKQFQRHYHELELRRMTALDALG